MNILSIQSWVSYGHAGNASAVFPMQRMGIEVWAVNTVQFSNHTGYGAWRGQVYTGDSVRELVDGIEERGALSRCDGVLSGYMGDAGIGEAVLHAVARTRLANPGTLYCCDPVIGDVEPGIFVRAGIPEFMRERAVPAADIVTPNQFELELLTQLPVRNSRDLARAVSALHKMGPKIVMVTSVQLDDTPDDAVDIVVSAGDAPMRVRTPRLPISPNGAGDAVAALFFAKFLKERSAEAALAHAAAATYGLLKKTVEAGSYEILTVAAQDEFVAPTQHFPVEHLSA
ncbi:MAG TPA: pyridoxal kinase PdxY [Tianweitania sediminis]|jgi:pyridoxine kinase|nr:pyridoxal kinase PdxY [Tianweitania sediminis]